MRLIVYRPDRCPRRPRPVSDGDVAPACRRLLGLVRQEPGWEGLKLAIQPDRAHLFVRVWPTTPANDVVRACEGRTSHDLRRDSPWSRRLPSLWSRALSAGTAGATIRRDVEAQKGVQRVETRTPFAYRV